MISKTISDCYSNELEYWSLLINIVKSIKMSAADTRAPVSGPGSLLSLSPDKLLETHSVAQAEVVAGQLTR